MNCGTTLVKYLLFLFNVIFFLTGAAILGVSIWLVVDDTSSDYLEIVNNASGNHSIEIAMYGMIAIGAFVFLVGFLGCCGACTESSCMLLFYAIFVGLIFALQVAAGVLMIVYKDDIETELEKQMSKQVTTEVIDSTEDVLSMAWFGLQYELSCCGSVDYTDYQNSKYVNTSNYVVPATCCVLNANKGTAAEPNVKDYAKCQEEAGKSNPDPNFLHTKGCYEEIISWINNNSTILIGVALGLAVFQLLCIIFACCVRSEI